MNAIKNNWGNKMEYQILKGLTEAGKKYYLGGQLVLLTGYAVFTGSLPEMLPSALVLGALSLAVIWDLCCYSIWSTSKATNK
jgi:hypothetical protein